MNISKDAWIMWVWMMIPMLILFVLVVDSIAVNNRYDDVVRDYVMCTHYRGDVDCSHIIMDEFAEDILSEFED